MTLEWTSSYEDELLTDLLFDSNLSLREIAHQMLVEEKVLRDRIKRLKLGWIRRQQGAASRGQASLAAIMRKLLPGEKIVCEEPIGERLFLDVYCPKYKLAAEYHGRQHFEYIRFFHKDATGFQESMHRDERKQEICKDLGIALMVVRYNDQLDESSIYERMLEAIRSTPMAEKSKKESLKGQPFYEKMKQRRREYQRQSYRRMKGK